MKYIKTFDLFLNESYLSGSRQPLYHVSRHGYEVMKSDMLKTTRNSDKTHSVCLTRSNYYNITRRYGGAIRFVLDADKLKLAGYKIYPIDEMPSALLKTPKRSKEFKAKMLSQLHKSDINTRELIHGLDVTGGKGDDEFGYTYPVEYEERCDVNITNLGKYLIGIDIPLYTYKEWTNGKYIAMLEEYIEKYPHIVIRVYEPHHKYGIKRSEPLTIEDIKKMDYDTVVSYIE